MRNISPLALNTVKYPVSIFPSMVVDIGVNGADIYAYVGAKDVIHGLIDGRIELKISKGSYLRELEKGLLMSHTVAKLYVGNPMRMIT